MITLMISNGDAEVNCGVFDSVQNAKDHAQWEAREWNCDLNPLWLCNADLNGDVHYYTATSPDGLFQAKITEEVPEHQKPGGTDVATYGR